METWMGIVLAVVTVTGSVLAARIASRSSEKVKEMDVDASAYERAERINAAAFLRLEADVTALKALSAEQSLQISDLKRNMAEVTQAFRIAINFIEQFLLWERDGSTPPRPNIPEFLERYLAPDLIREHARQQKADDESDAKS